MRGAMTRKQTRTLVRILVAVALYVVALLLPLEGAASFAAFLIVYAVIGWDILYRAVRGILHGQVFDENFLMCVATIGALALGDAREAVAVMLFYQVGEWFQGYAVGRSRRSIAGLMDIRPDHANLLDESGNAVEVEPENVNAGAFILVKPGERIPLDGIVTSGASALDQSALTGESLPRDVAAGSEVTSGCINLTGALTVRVLRPYGESTVARILELVEHSSARKSQTEQFITRFARWYTPAVCVAALALALLPPLLTGQPFGVWVYRALTFLVISCPCALVISIPLSFFGGIGGASRIGVLVKGGNYLEALARTDRVVFDKTGTLTQGRFSVSRVLPAPGVDEQDLLEAAACAESYSTHPIAQSIRAAWPEELDLARLSGVEELAGHGVRAYLDGLPVLAGNALLMEQNGIDVEGLAPRANSAVLGSAAGDGWQADLLPAGTASGADPAGATTVYVARDGRLLGAVQVADTLRPDAAAAIAGLRAAGVRRCVMLTGDNEAAARKVGAQLGLDDVYAGLLPQDKVAQVERMLAEDDGKSKGKLAFVGDGVNDAPVLARADVGIAMGGLGSDAAIEAADVVIMTDEPAKLPTAIRIARKTQRIVWQNIVLALGIKGIVLVLGALGFASMWAAVFADVGVAVLAILNAMRMLLPLAPVSTPPARPAGATAPARDGL